MSHGMPDNIDPYKEVLLNKLTTQGYFHDVPDLILESKSISVPVPLTTKGQSL